MQVVPEQRAELVTTLAAALKAAGLSTQVIADESSSTGLYLPLSSACYVLTLHSIKVRTSPTHLSGSTRLSANLLGPMHIINMVSRTPVDNNKSSKKAET